MKKEYKFNKEWVDLLLEHKNNEYIKTFNSSREANYISGKDIKFINNKTQQKEFINYLEDKIDICDGFLDTVKSDLRNTPYRVISSKKTNITIRIKENEIAHKIYKEILQKYKEIIGGKDEK